jgi:hypothetical protein
MFQQELA